MQVKLYLDEDSMHHALLRTLRSRGIDVVTAVECQMISAPDDAQLEFAAREGRVICTFNVADFARLHAEFARTGRGHGGIVLMSQQHHQVGDQIRRLLRLVAALSAEEMENRLEFLSDWNP